MSELDIPQLPPEALELLNDPRLQGMADPLPGFSPEERLLLPANPPAVGDSPFLLMGESSEGPSGQVTWVNEPVGTRYLDRVGDGRGLAEFHDRPRLEENIEKPEEMPEVWRYLSWFVASPRFVDILSRFDPSVVETVEIDWVFSDGQKLGGYVFLDVRRLIHAYDYQRTAAVVRRARGRTHIHRLGYPRALKEISDSAVHVFREAYYRTHVLMSRALASELSMQGIRTIYFQDPASAAAVRFA